MVLLLIDKLEVGDLVSWLVDVKKVEGCEIFNYSIFNWGKVEWVWLLFFVI